MSLKLPTKKQKEILTRVLDYIKENPDRLDMHDWGAFHPTCNVTLGETVLTNKSAKTFHTGRGNVQPIPACGTTACLAGTVLLVTKQGKSFLKNVIEEGLESISVNPDNDNVIEFPYDTPEIASNILGLTDDQANRLFYFKEWEVKGDSGWPEELSKEYQKAKNGKERFAVLKKRIERFFNTGE